MKKKIKRYPITDRYVAVVEVDSPAMWIYIERKYRIFFNLIPWSEPYGYSKGFVLGDQPDGSKIYTCYSRPGFISRDGVALVYKNIDTFDLKVEIAKLYNSVVSLETETERKEKLFESKINNLLT